MCLARLDLASGYLGLGELDGAVEQIRAVFTDAEHRRTDSVRRRLHQVRELLENTDMRTSPLAGSVRDEIIDFCTPSPLALPGGTAP